MRLAEKGQFEVFVAKHDSRITFTYASSAADGADTLLRSHELEDRMGLRSGSDLDLERHQRTINRIRDCLSVTVTRNSADCIAYEYTPDLIAATKLLAEFVAEQKIWELDPGLAFGAYTFRDVRNFWATIQALTVVHEIAHYTAAGDNPHAWPIGSIVNLKRKACWISAIGGISGLSQSAVEQLLDLYTYDSSVSDKTPALQPFHCASPDSLSAPGVLLTGTDHERNFIKLLNRHPSLRQFRDAVNRSKEPRALQQLSELFPEPDFVSRKQVIIAGLTDADLVIYERQTGFVIIVQHKWLIGPDTADESASNDDELLGGVKQARDSRDYWRTYPDKLRAAMRLDTASAVNQIDAVVVCRGAEPTGFVGFTAPPIITEKAFRALLACQSDLARLWALLSERPDHTEAARRMRDTIGTIELAGYSFIFPALGIPG